MSGTIERVLSRRHFPAPNEEGTSVNRIVAIATAIIAAVASFLFLPFEGALAATLGLGTLVSLFSCRPKSAGEPSPHRGPHPVYVDTRPLFRPAHVEPFRRRPLVPEIVPPLTPFRAFGYHTPGHSTMPKHTHVGRRTPPPF